MTEGHEWQATGHWRADLAAGEKYDYAGFHVGVGKNVAEDDGIEAIVFSLIVGNL